ncbi:family 1 glycosylhydrolase [Agaribacter marinus]|uniref:Glycoside hydrolase family 1 protein n=1 Tax=Virgibacillus salarius TaxID=447199 RepID=A0A941I9N3_9BACI|nr:glycoside hydrolase family 1 protein [Virgibacillus salarius]MBR7794506.1 glycoside hydrolase family 1 protein [Virgibacillus salarius]NAZ07228.1 family 1 glycosylhydrolase [Agaribacter marinus]WBX78799.1 glycoside hydrolase family 1 protein [Virgibacillus salarius]
MHANDYIFPTNFKWGAAASATQTEGSANDENKAKNIWDYWYQLNPERFHEGVGPMKTSDFYQRYTEDIKRMKAIHLNSFRTSISWSRLLPDGINVNGEAVSFYQKMFDQLIEHGIEPIVNLFHFDMPLLMQEKGGWESLEVVEAFNYYAHTAFELFGEKIKRWTTFNEPIVPVEMGYLNHYHYPCVVDMKRAVVVAYHSMLASAKVIQTYHESNQTGKIGIILNLTPSYPRSDTKGDVKAARIADLFFNRSFLDPSVYGSYPEELTELLRSYDLLPETNQEDLAIIKNNTVDFLGVNYYQPRRVKEREKPYQSDQILPEKFFESYIWPERRMNPYRGWEIYEKGIYDLAINIRDNYGNIPWYVAENGMGVENEERFSDESGMIQDDYRIEFYKEHLKWLHKAIREGSNCFGYHVWTFMDNWSWLNAYKNRYGLYRVDIRTQERSLKKSGQWFGDVARKNGF